jgi:hypothetical protein
MEYDQKQTHSYRNSIYSWRPLGERDCSINGSRKIDYIKSIPGGLKT